MDISDCHNTYRNSPENPSTYALGAFNIAKNVADVNGTHGISLPLYFLSKIVRKFLGEETYYNIPFLSCRYLDGYWQSEKYFCDFRLAIQNEIKLKNEESECYKNILSEIGSIQSPISLHIRRGDYEHDPIIKKILSCCTMSYYDQAIKFVTRDLTGVKFFIFSDDINWVKENFKINFPVFYVTGNNITNYEEMILMSKCKHNIIANSSFSWWGAWLNENPGKIVVAPKKWFNNPKADQKDIIPESWIKI